MSDSELSSIPIAAVVLAAGMSLRMGQLKMLLPFGEKPMLARVVENLLATENISPIVVVTGHAKEEIEAALRVYRVVRVPNLDYAAGGMLSSVQTGVRALPAGCAAFLLALGDQPMVRPDTLRKLLVAWHQSRAAIVLPTHDGKRGHPVLFSSALILEIIALSAEATLKTVVTRHAAGVEEIPVDDPFVLLDIDTPEDYQRALHLWQSQ